jgi:hypothetical protein
MPRQDIESDATFPAQNGEPIEVAQPIPAQTLAEAAMRIRARRNEIRPSVPQPNIETEATVLNHLSNVERELDRYIRVQAVENNNISVSVQNIARTNLIILDKLDKQFPRPPPQ